MKATRPSTGAGQADSRIEAEKSRIAGYERLHVLVTEQQYRQLKRLAYERDVSLAEVVRQALGDWLPKQG